MHKTQLIHSTIFRIIIAVIVLVLPINIMTLILSNMVIENNKEQIVNVAQNIIEMSGQNMEDMLRRANRSLINLRLNDEDFVTLSYPTKNITQTELANALFSAKQTMQQNYQQHPGVTMMYYQFPDTGYVLLNGFSSISYEIRREIISTEVEKEPSQTTWECFYIEDSAVLFSCTNWGNANFGIFVELDQTLSDMNLSNPPEGRCIYFTNNEENIVTQSGMEYLEAKGKTIEELEQDENYQIISYELGDYDLVLNEVIDWEYEMNRLPGTILVLQWMSIFTTILVIPVLLWYMSRQVNLPLNRLMVAIEHIERGDLDYRIKAGKKGREFERINQSFNAMMDQVKELKIDVYEKELERKNIKMSYLNQQIQPHFILNAMNIIYSYEPEEYPLIQKMVLCISKYFRYIVKVNAEYVCLYQELDHIKNYFEIQKARYPGLFFAIVEYEDGLKNALVPPLLVQNFAENSIKHSLKVGNKVTIFVVAEYYREEKGPTKMRIRLADTGQGISDEILEKIKIFQETGEIQEGLGVGIQNAIERLKYLYGDRSYIRFWRDETYTGTNVEIILPIFFGNEER